MFERDHQTTRQATPEVHELKVAVFDLSQNALASASFRAPALVIDHQPLDENGMPGISKERRAMQIGARQLLDLPPVEIISRIHTDDEDEVCAYAVAARRPIDFRRYTVRRFDLDEVAQIAHQEVNLGIETKMDTIDAKLILASLAIKEIRNKVPHRYRLG